MFMFAMSLVAYYLLVFAVDSHSSRFVLLFAIPLLCGFGFLSLDKWLTERQEKELRNTFIYHCLYGFNGYFQLLNLMLAMTDLCVKFQKAKDDPKALDKLKPEIEKLIQRMEEVI